MGSTIIQVPSGLGLTDVRGGAGRIAHVMQAVEARDEIVRPAGTVLCQPHLEARVGRYTLRLGVRPRLGDRTGMKNRNRQTGSSGTLSPSGRWTTMAAAEVGN